MTGLPRVFLKTIGSAVTSLVIQVWVMRGEAWRVESGPHSSPLHGSAAGGTDPDTEGKMPFLPSTDVCGVPICASQVQGIPR